MLLVNETKIKQANGDKLFNSENNADSINLFLLRMFTIKKAMRFD